MSREKEKKISPKGFKVKWTVIFSVILAIVLIVNIVLYGPLQNVLNIYFAPKVEVSVESVENAKIVCEEIENEGIVLMKNEDNILPLENTEKLNVFGWASTNPVYGGTGSGSVDLESVVTLEKGLENGGFELNKELSDFYKEYRDERPEVALSGQDWTLPEPSADDYTSEMLQNAKDFSDTALIVLSRSGGEDADLPTSITDENTFSGSGWTASGVTYADSKDVNPDKHYLELSNTEEELVEMVADEFEKVIVVLNMANTMELNWVDQYDSIKGVLWVGDPGQYGFNALGNVLNGTVNPSGHTADIYVKDLTQSPGWNNFGRFAYKDVDEANFVNYNEGIYVGYRYYETRFQDDDSYYEQVQYPFGYGLSYTEFEQEMGDLQVSDDGTIQVNVKVTNVGNTYAGKSVVQLYCTAPYTEGGIEKSYVSLLSFEKTGLLKPGRSETVTLTFSEEDLASYDYINTGAYVLEKGDYEIKLMENSHELLDSKIYTVDKEIIYSGENKRSSDQMAAENQFAFADNGMTYLSRENNFANYEEATKAPENYELGNVSLEYKIQGNDNVQMPTTGKDNGIKLEELVGKDYDDPLWDTLLDEMSIDDMNLLITFGGYKTAEIKSIGKVATNDIDGPAGLSSFVGGSKQGCADPVEVVLASTWNKELAVRRGEKIGIEALELEVSGWYGPAMNLHRSAFGGRNFEYYSEDPLLSGKMAAGEVEGAKSKGLYAYVKHFALNEQETARCERLCTWSNEQAIRELYLKPFELAIKEGGATAVMTSFNYIGNVWAGGCEELLNTVLRNEWGFQGMVLTDYFGGYGFMDADQAILTGNDCMLSTTGGLGAKLNDSQSAYMVAAMRTACHNILYTVANSNAYYTQEQRDELTLVTVEEEDDSFALAAVASSLNLEVWMLIGVIIDAVIIIALIVAIVCIRKKYRKLSGIKKESEE